MSANGSSKDSSSNSKGKSIKDEIFEYFNRNFTDYFSGKFKS